MLPNSEPRDCRKTVDQIKNKKTQKRATDNEFFKGPETGANATTLPKKAGPKAGEMSVDDFFQGGFEILDKEQAQPAKDAQKKDAGKLGKRKRDDAKSKANDSDEQLSDAEGGEDSDGSDEGDDEDLMADVGTGMTKEAMEELAIKDPEFYKFLKENDPEALDYDDNEELSDAGELSGSDEDMEEEQPKKKQKKAKKTAQTVAEDGSELTPDMIAKWKTLMTETHSLRAARQVVIAFRCAAHLHELDETSSPKYSITNPDAFNDILVVALKHLPEILNHHLPVKESASGRVYVNTDTKKFKTLSMLVRSFATSITHLLSTLSDEATLNLTHSLVTNYHDASHDQKAVTLVE